MKAKSPDYSPALSAGGGRFSIRFLAANLLLAAIYTACGKLGLALALVNASASAVWPPTGIALAALLVWGTRLWPGILLGAFLVNITTQGSLATTLGISCGNTLEAVAGAWLVSRFADGPKAFEKTNTFFRFVLLAPIFSTVLSATAGVSSLCLGGFAPWDKFGAIWLTWWLGDLSSNLVIAPLAIMWLTQGVSRLRPKQLWEAAGLLVSLAVVGGLVFLLPKFQNYRINYLTIPPLLWAAYRFGGRGAASAVFLMAGIALWGTLHGKGPFTSPDFNVSLLFLQAFVGTVAVTALALGSAVSERQQVQQALRLQSVALESAANAIVITGRDGSIDWVNDAFTRLTGYRLEEVLGKNPRLLNSGRHSKVFFQEMWDTVLAGRVWHGEVINKRQDGTLYTEEMTVTPVWNEDGTHTHFIAIKQDITERKNSEQALKQAKEELATANARLEEIVSERTARLRDVVAELEHFSYSIVHDLRAPLRGIQGFAGVIEEEFRGQLTPEAGEYLSRIQRAANRMDQLITDALSYSKTVQNELPRRPVDLNALLRGMIESYPALGKSEAEIVLEGPFPLVVANEAGLTQCFSNLLHNAVKFVKPGELPRVRIRAEPRPPMVRMWVEDHGIGIPPQGLKRMFKMFERVHGAEYEGTGIGLALVRKVAERMGGSVGVESEPGQGSRFWIELKAAHPDQGAQVPSLDEHEELNTPFGRIDAHR